MMEISPQEIKDSESLGFLGVQLVCSILNHSGC